MEINIALAPDDNYVPHAITVIRSVLGGSKTPESVNVWILDGGLSLDSRALLKGAAQNVFFAEIDKEMFSGLPSHGYITVSTWYRFALARLLPPEVSKVLYLDCDVAVNCDLGELFCLDISNYALAAVKDCLWRKFNKRVGLAKDYAYFNAGVLLINLDYWRAENVEGALFAFLAESEAHRKLLDQSVINIVLGAKHLELPLCWNAQYLPPFLEESCYGAAEAAEAFANPKIVHYVNKFKPWDSALGWLNPLHKFFTKYMDTPPRYVGCKAFVFLKLLLLGIARKPTLIFRKSYWNNVFICAK